MKAGGLMGASEAWALQQKRIVEICWWLKPEHSALQDSTAEAWETLRRTRAYDRLFETAKAFRHENLIERMASRTAIRDIIYAKKPASVSEQAWLPLGEHDPIQQWSHLFFHDCAPDCDWIELGEKRRYALRGQPFLPRQERTEYNSPMHVFICELERDPKNPNQERTSRLEWTLHDLKPLPESGIVVLPKGTARKTYVVVSFELGQPAEALERQFATELKSRLFPGRSNAPIRSGDSPDQVVYPTLWQEALDPNAGTRAPEDVVVIPNRQSPFVLCWIPARNGWKQVQSRFNNAVREEKRADLAKFCSKYWALSETVPGVTGGTTQVLPPWPRYHGLHPKVKRKPAHLKNFWLGLTAYEYRNAGVKFDKSVEGQSALAFFKANGYPDDPACIRPDLASFTDRLREIDDLYAKII